MCVCISDATTSIILSGVCSFIVGLLCGLIVGVVTLLVYRWRRGKCKTPPPPPPPSAKSHPAARSPSPEYEIMEPATAIAPTELQLQDNSAYEYIM